MKKYLPEGMSECNEELKNRALSEKNLREAFAADEPVEAVAVLCDSRHNLHFELGEIKGFMPHDECAEGVSDGSVRDIAVISRVNKLTDFKVTGFCQDENGNKIAVLSRKLYQQECRRNYIEFLREGDIIDAKVCHLEPFGAFCDIGAGIVALLPIDSISISRIPDPSARFCVGDEIKAVVRAIDENGRITLSHKELLGTWEENAALFNPGETVTGIIRSVEQYGVFIELMPNLAGLAEYVPDVKPGCTASVFIKSINPQRMKIKLIIVEAADEIRKKKKIKYFISDGHLDLWMYSPPQAAKTVCTDFNKSSC